MITIFEQTEMRVVPALISFIFLIIFIAPVFFGIVNLGNGTGVAVSVVCLSIFTFFGKFCGIFSMLWQKPAGKVLIFILTAIVVSSIVLASVISVFMLKAASDSPEGCDTTIVVLGCKVKNGAPSLMLKRRLDAAYDYLIEYKDVNVIVSGGKGTDEIISEGQCMSDYLISRGISSDRIIVEDKSTSTHENLEFSKRIIEQNDLNKKITIVTDGYHQLRAEMIAEDLGLEAYNISAATSPWLIPTYWVREWFGVLYQFIFGGT